MDVSSVGNRGEAPWKKMSTEELENQYSPSRWAVQMRPEEALKTYLQIGIEATRRARATRRSLLHVPYGDSEGDKLDVYLPREATEALPCFVFFHGGYWQSGRHPGPDGRSGDTECGVCAEAASAQWALCQGGWKASFEELCNVDHFEIIENLTQKDDVLTQIILKTIFQKF
ncbi:kynurenine formamidase isoform X7 [Nycticebus coucang]|uniref:kynurenine formamidase isoform X7 n=1 Tax=Nycticebus coucang TaxID=9470 RepID=UPI00234E188E|nr:kynurenine formamidase isoform X7 [Nycticebus coucang]